MLTLASDKENERVQTLILGLNSTFRWCLSGTPRHANFSDIRDLASLLGVHLGIDEPLPWIKLRKYADNKEKSGLESLSQYMEIRSMQWHERRHKLAQAFLCRFVRQNVAEIDEIPFGETEVGVDLPPAERAIYLELETHLESLDMNNKQALRSRKKSTGDRESRMQQILRDSDSAEEALLKCCSHFGMATDKMVTALETVDDIIQLRVQEQAELEKTIVRAVAAAFRQRRRILQLQPDWSNDKQESFPDPVAQYLAEVQLNKSVTHGADEEIHLRVLDHVKAGALLYARNPKKKDPMFAEANGERANSDDSDNESGKKRKPSEQSKKDCESEAERLQTMKLALRNHMHTVRSMGKELCGRIRSLRYIERIRSYQSVGSKFECGGCKAGNLSVDKVGVLSCCGHFGCLDCLKSFASQNACVDAGCSARVSPAHVLSSDDLGLQEEDRGGGKFGRKITAMVEKIKEVTGTGDRAIVFCQFDDLAKKVAEALESSGVATRTLEKGVRAQIATVSMFQKPKPATGDPRVLLLKMDDERSAGLNLTSLNHAFFCSPTTCQHKARVCLI